MNEMDLMTIDVLIANIIFFIIFKSLAIILNKEYKTSELFLHLIAGTGLGLTICGFLNSLSFLLSKVF